MAMQPAQQQAAALTITHLMSGNAVKARFNEILGKKAPGFISSVLAVSKTGLLQKADPSTILNAAVVAATLDLPINPNLGFSYIVPYNNRKEVAPGRWEKVTEAQFQLGYKGYIQLAQRSGLYRTINATDIREGELVSTDILSGDIVVKAQPNREQKEVVGYAAYFELLNGFRKTLYMSKAELEAHAMQYSQSYANEKSRKASLWATQFDVMAKKTVIKLLLSKFGPLTTEMQKAQAFDQAVIKDADDENSALYVDNQYGIQNANQGEVVDFEEEADPAAAPSKPDWKKAVEEQQDDNAKEPF